MFILIVYNNIHHIVHSVDDSYIERVYPVSVKPLYCERLRDTTELILPIYI